MQLGTSFPQDATMSSPAAVRDFVQAVEGMGFDYLTGGEHVLGADITNRPGWTGPYTHKNVWREPFVLLGYVAGVTQHLKLGTSVLVLPQRQTAVVAKQAAEVDVLSNGRFFLGVGVGWSEVEFEALDQDFHNRGRRVEEQVAVLRALWTQEVVTFDGKWHHIIEAGINPRPMQRPIPIWMGGDAEPVLRRIGRLADGWFPDGRSASDMALLLDRVRGYAREAGRDPAGISVGARMGLASGTPEDWAKTHAAWGALGATHFGVSNSNAGSTSVDQHIAALRRFKEAVG